ncbi:unnamed protein product, partial [Heterosigma akashiwo]
MVQHALARGALVPPAPGPRRFALPTGRAPRRLHPIQKDCREPGATFTCASPRDLATSAQLNAQHALRPLPPPRGRARARAACAAAAACVFSGGAAAGRARLAAQILILFPAHDRYYKETRDGLLGMEYSTKLSPWLAHGCLSPRQIICELRKFESTVVKNESTYWIFFELLVRDYFHLVALRAGAALFRPLGPRATWRSSGGGRPGPAPSPPARRPKEGRTGYPFIDANMRELRATGFMSNRGRQNVASFLCNDLGLDWRLGAEFFEERLIDYDPASNWVNWAYVAGVGPDPRSAYYKFQSIYNIYRYFNIIKQGLVYDPEARYVLHWIPELACI